MKMTMKVLRIAIIILVTVLSYTNSMAQDWFSNNCSSDATTSPPGGSGVCPGTTITYSIPEQNTHSSPSGEIIVSVVYAWVVNGVAQSSSSTTSWPVTWGAAGGSVYCSY